MARKIPEIGDLIVLPIRLNDITGPFFGKAQIEDQGKNYVFRAIMGGGYCTRFFVVSENIRSAGLVCFCYQKKLPKNHIGFKIIKVNKGEKSVIVKPVSGTINDLMQCYKFKKGEINSGLL